MLRTLFVLGIAAIGGYFALQGAFPALLFYLWIAYFRPEEWVWSDFIRTFNLSLITGIYVVGVSVLSGARLRINSRVMLLALFLAQSSISVLLSPYSSYSYVFWQDFFKSVIITYLIIVLVTDRRKLRTTLIVIAASLSFEPAKQAWVQFVVSPGSKNYNIIGFLGDESGVGVGMLMLAPILAALARTTARRWEQWTWRLLLVAILYRAITTYSRGTFLGFGALALMYFLRSQRKLQTALALVLVGGLILPVLPPSFWDRMSTITMSEEEMDRSSRGRIHFWTVAIEMANANPFTGVGHHAYSQAYDEYDFSNGEYGKERSIHSSWFGVLAELGYPGLVLFVWLILSAFTACRRVRKLVRGSPELAELREYAAAFEVALVAFAVSGSFIIFQYTEVLWHFIGFTTALLAIATAEQAELQPSAVPSQTARGPARWHPRSPREPSPAGHSARGYASTAPGER